jgi:hypothetical protein
LCFYILFLHLCFLYTFHGGSTAMTSTWKVGSRLILAPSDIGITPVLFVLAPFILTRAGDSFSVLNSAYSVLSSKQPLSREVLYQSRGLFALHCIATFYTFILTMNESSTEYLDPVGSFLRLVHGEWGNAAFWSRGRLTLCSFSDGSLMNR